MGLLDNLISYWKLDEVSGSRVDSHGGNTLTDNNTVGSGVGLGSSSPTTADFVAANSEYLSHASNSDLQAGDIDFTIVARFRIDSALSDLAGYELVTKDDDAANSRDYTLDVNRWDVTYGGTVVRFYINGGAGADIIYVPTLLAIGQVYFVRAWHVKGTSVNIQLDNGTIYTSPTATVPQTSSAEFRIGAREYAGFEGFTDGAIDEVGYWKRLLTTTEWAALYSSGHGFAYPFRVPTPVFCCGFECGQFGSVGQHWALTGTGAISTSTIRTGARSLRINPTLGTGVVTRAAGLMSDATVWILRAYVRFTTLPTLTTDLLCAPTQIGQYGVYFNASDSKIYAGSSLIAMGASGVAVTTGIWYRLDVKVDVSANPRIIDVQVDGVACGQATVASAATTGDGITVGITLASATADVFFDDVIVSNSNSDYPIGQGAVYHFVPTSDGTHNIAGAADFQRGGTSTDITNATTTAYQLVDDVPLDDVTPDTDDHIRIVAPPAVTDYVELVFGPASGVPVPRIGPRAVEVIAEVFAAGTGLSDEIIKLNDNGTVNNIYDGTQIAGVTTGTYKQKHYALAPSSGSVWVAGGLGNGDFNDLRLRYGYATDANPDKSLMCVMIEAEFADYLIEYGLGGRPRGQHGQMQHNQLLAT